MTDRFPAAPIRAPIRRHPRWPAVAGAVTLWGAAALSSATPHHVVAAERGIPLPAAEPLRFLFPKGSTDLPRSIGPYGSALELANSQALGQLLDLQPRLAALPVQPVWAVSSGKAGAQIGRLAIIIESAALGRSVGRPALPPRGSADSTPPLALEVEPPAGYDVVEYRLAPRPSDRGDCATERQLIIPGLPAGPDGKALRLTFVGGTVGVVPGTAWRDAPRPGHRGEAGPWRLWNGPGEVARIAPGTSKDMSDHIRPWNGTLGQDTASCATRFVPLEG